MYARGELVHKMGKEYGNNELRIRSGNSIKPRYRHLRKIELPWYSLDSKSQGKMRTILFILLNIFLIFSLSIPSAMAARSSGGSGSRYAAIVIESSTGKILHQENADEIRHPASLTKVMTLLVLFDQMAAGKVDLSDRITVSKHAASMSPTKLGIPAGSTIAVRDAIGAIVTESANDMAVAVAEHLAGSETAFAKYMTKRAQQIGMSRTRFKNASGLPNPAQVTTARDMARMAKFILTYYPQYYKFFSMRNFVYKGVSHHNHNRLMDSYEGMDGFKTGYINASGFNLIASAKRNGIRLVGVVFGGRTAFSRNEQMASLLDDGFDYAKRLYYAGQLTASPAERGTKAYAEPTTQSSEATASREPILKTKQALSRPTETVSPVTSRDQQPQFDQMMRSYTVTQTPNNQTTIAQPDGQNITAGRYASNTTTYTTSTSSNGWAIQIGAYQNRTMTDQALYHAQKSLPSHLAKAQAVIVPMRASDSTWVYRARLSGFTRDEALQACSYFKDCMTVAPAM